MKKIYFILTGLMFCFFTSTNAKSRVLGNFKNSNDREEKITTYPFNQTGTLSIFTKNGTITVTVHEKKEVIVKTIKKGDKADFSKLGSCENFTKESGSITEVYNDNDSNHFSCDASISYEITVPTLVTLTTETKNGNIHIKHVNGSIVAKSINGEIEIEHSSGLCSTKTKNGSTKLKEVSHLTESSSTNGSISLKAEKLFSFGKTIKLISKNGNVTFEVRQLDKNNIELDTTNGQISAKVTKPQWLINTSECISFNSGQAFVKATTRHGRISVRSF